MTLAAMRNGLRSLSSKGFFHIFGASCINKLFSFAANIIIVWFLSKEDYGIFSYAFSIYTLATLVTGFGLLSGMLQFCLEPGSEARRNSIYYYILTRGLVIDLVISSLIMLAGLLITFPVADAGNCLILLGPLLLFDYIFQYVSTMLRILYQNKRYAALQTINTFLYFISGCTGAFLGGIVGLIAGRYLAYIVSAVCAVPMLRCSGFNLLPIIKLAKTDKKELWTYSALNQVASTINQTVFIVNVLLVGVFVGDAASVANFKVSTMIPEGLGFVAGTIAVFVLPYFISHSKDKIWFSRQTTRLLILTELGFTGLVILLILFASPIILLFWGEDYSPAIPLLKLLAIGVLFSTLHLICVNLLASMRRTAWNIVVSLLSLLTNLILGCTLIPLFGITGAAISVVGTYAVAAFAALGFLRKAISKIES